MTTTLAIALRAAQPADAAFEQHLFASTRDDLRPLGPEVFDGLVAMQFRAQSMTWRLEHPDAERKIVTIDGQAVGRMVVDGSKFAIEILDVAIVSEHRNQGIGTAVLRSVIGQADRTLRPVRLHVEKGSRAQRLFERLGFLATGETGLHVAMSRG
jgi:ribosomal protein S18 acetylase RimI-like enzyme